MPSSKAGMSVSKRKSLKQHGLGNKVMRADPFNDEKLEILRKKSLLGKGGFFSMKNVPFFVRSRPFKTKPLVLSCLKKPAFFRLVQLNFSLILFSMIIF